MNASFGQRIAKMGMDGWELVGTSYFQETAVGGGDTYQGTRYAFKRLVP